MERDDWIALCAHRLHHQWRTVDPDQLDELATDLWGDERLRAMAPAQAAVEWLAPVTVVPEPCRLGAANGILARIPGALIAEASQTLPPAGDGQPAERQAEIEVPGIGRMRITFRLSSSKRGRWVNWFWTATFAEAAR